MRNADFADIKRDNRLSQVCHSACRVLLPSCRNSENSVLNLSQHAFSVSFSTVFHQSDNNILILRPRGQRVMNYMVVHQ